MLPLSFSPYGPRNCTCFVRLSSNYRGHQLQIPEDYSRYPVKAANPAGSGSIRTTPLEVLYEIFAYLHPLDLLRLARTSRRLRDILMCRSARFVWKAALANVEGLPFCPLDLTEPQYASLVFDEYCHFCLAPNIQQVLWACRVRCCDKCLRIHFVPESLLKKTFPLHPDFCNYEDILPYTLHSKPKPGKILYFLPTVKAYIQELLVISCSTSAVAQWNTQKSLEQSERLKHASLCESWVHHYAYRPSSDIGLILSIIGLSLLLILLW